MDVWQCPVCDALESPQPNHWIEHHCLEETPYEFECGCGISDTGERPMVYLEWRDRQYVPMYRLLEIDELSICCTCKPLLDTFYTPPEKEIIYEDIIIDTPQGPVHLDADLCRLFQISK
jgi:hypothetical protein